ncbi:MAG: hypothetical protein M3405_01955 [Acidobacteriota bacterium]|nr:hypothetical protein [Acidobacteriota bacterium]
MNIISSILIIFAILLSVLTFICLVGWLMKGGINIILPGLGLVIGFPFIIILLLIIQIGIVFIASAAKPTPSPTDSEIQKNQPYETSDFR